MLQVLPVLVLFAIMILPMGKYLYHIAVGARTFADPVFDRVDGAIYRACGIDRRDMTWKQYASALLFTNAVMVLVGYLILRVQSIPLLNPNAAAGMEPTLSLNTLISFITNTNLQHYAGESALSYLSQMAVITFLMFTSAASGYSACMAFLRGLTGRASMGSYYADMVRVTTRVLLPLCVAGGVALIALGVPQTLRATVTAHTLEGKLQDIAMGPIASLEIIKHIGTNGGGFLTGNSATPFENPSALTNLIEMLSMMLLPGACVVAFGHMARDRRGPSGETRPENTAARSHDAARSRRVWLGREAKPIFAVMMILFVAGIAACVLAERAGNPGLFQTGLIQDMGNMEGKETRFGVAQSALFTAITTAFTTGSVNNMHDSLTPLGGAAPLVNMMLNLVFGGKGVGLMNMILYAILAVFICGLMIGRTPEYLGKKIEGREMKLAALGIIVHPLLILSFTALSLALPAGLQALSNPGHHGLSQALYEYTSAAANNGSGFEGLMDNTAFWNLTTALVMFFGRYLPIVLQMAIAGSLLRKPAVADSIGTLRTDTGTFGVSLLMVVMVIAALTFFPALVLGPIAEFATLGG